MDRPTRAFPAAPLQIDAKLARPRHGEPSAPVGLVARQDERLVEAALQQREWHDLPGDADLVGVADELPAACEHAVTNPLVPLRTAVDRGGQRFGPSDVFRACASVLRSSSVSGSAANLLVSPG
jgi:hypothetical protein